MPISSSNLQFLTALRGNNTREWFDAHKDDFLKGQEEFKTFHSSVEDLMRQHDQIDASKVYRIYRDVRFSKDKTPYKTHWAGSFRRATHYLRGGYYYQIEPGRSLVAGGFFGPSPQDLLHIRKQISQDPEALEEIINAPDFQRLFGGLKGEAVKTAPKGFSQDDPAIGYIRHKQFILEHYFTDEEVLAEDFAARLSQVFQQMRPYLDYMSEILTTDLNGESLL